MNIQIAAMHLYALRWKTKQKMTNFGYLFVASAVVTAHIIKQKPK